MNLNPTGWAARVLTPLLRIIRTPPNATVPVIAISEPVNSDTAALVNADVALVAKGTGATLAQVPDGTVAGGTKRGQYATDLQKARSAASQVASGSASVISGGQDNINAGSWSSIGGGLGNTVSNTTATIAGGNSNTASGDTATIAGGGANQCTSSNSFIGGGQSNRAQTNSHAAVCGGSGNTASGQYSFVGGGQNLSATATNSTVCGGQNNTSSGAYAFVGGGQTNFTSAAYSFISGGRRGNGRSIIGYHVFPACSIPVADASGVSQSALLLLGRQTTDATATVLASDGSAATTTNQVILPNNSAYSFSGEVIAGVTAAGNTARWTIDGAIKRGANAASTTMVGTPTVTMTHFDAGAATWVVAVTADTTNGGIAVTVTGAAATTIRWVAKIETTEMTY